ncbi:hypothetical protein Taro_031916 [Colocasia esculenta]|uniref:Uncharacterized protein n=1 Tax=Colocasia esculenta TaxID=4460 RepID=A0A843W2B7_COLES|nr:hypothetical protein [Colocasia esculenta]
MGLQQCGLQVVRLRGLAVWAWSTYWFTGCERDSGGHRVLNTKVHDIAIMEPLFSVVVCMRAACRAQGSAC